MLVSSRFASNLKVLITNTIQLNIIEVFRVNMHVQFLTTNALLLQCVVKTMINAVITRKKWLNKTHTTQKLHRNHIEV